MGTFFTIVFFLGGLWFILKVASMKSETHHIKEMGNNRYRKNENKKIDNIEQMVKNEKNISDQQESIATTLESKQTEYYIPQYNKAKKEFRPYTDEEKKAFGEKQKEKIRKGKEYEAYVAEYYRSLGYHVREHGKEKGKRDGGIDLIATNHKEAIMIQCKNWKAGSKYTINHEAISSFVGKVEMFIAKNIEYQKYEIKRIFTVSEPILDKSALAIINQNSEIVRYEHIPLPQ